MSFRCGTLKHFGVGTRGHHPTIARRSDAVCDLRASGSYRSRRIPQTVRPPVRRGRGVPLRFEDFSLPSSYSNRCYRRVVSCFRCCWFSLPLAWFGFGWFFFPSHVRKREPQYPNGGGRIFCEGDHSRFACETFSKLFRLRKRVSV